MISIVINQGLRINSPLPLNIYPLAFTLFVLSLCLLRGKFLVLVIGNVEFAIAQGHNSLIMCRFK